MAVEIVHLNRDTLRLEYGADIQRLMPWAPLNAPFEGAWAVVRAGTRSTLHSHHEYEMFVAVHGDAVVECDDEQSSFSNGDVALFRPGQLHRVLNDGTADFEFYSVWWDVGMAQRFISNNRQGALA
jgi:mannose-6-phosphate isomerase-like protein (cupin superfamily)